MRLFCFCCWSIEISRLFLSFDFRAVVFGAMYARLKPLDFKVLVEKGPLSNGIVVFAW